MTVAPKYPDAFYVGHRLFTGGYLPKPVWGDLLDGPEPDFEHVVTLVIDSYDTDPTKANLRVWYIEPGKPAEDVTASVLEAVADRLEDRA